MKFTEKGLLAKTEMIRKAADEAANAAIARGENGTSANIIEGDYAIDAICFGGQQVQLILEKNGAPLSAFTFQSMAEFDRCDHVWLAMANAVR